MQLLNGYNKFFSELYLDRFNFQACFISQWILSYGIQCFEQDEKKGGGFLCHIVSYCICYVKSAILNNFYMVSWHCDIFFLLSFCIVLYFSLIWWIAVLQSLCYGSYIGHSVFGCLGMPDPNDVKMRKKMNSIKAVEDHTKKKADLYYAETITGKPQVIYKIWYVQLLKTHQIWCKHVKKVNSLLFPLQTRTVLTLSFWP